MACAILSGQVYATRVEAAILTGKHVDPILPLGAPYENPREWGAWVLDFPETLICHVG
jgi:hypothetical protein